ncbi:MAG: glycoside hydrolase family 3 C-terminal domain-containing protein [Ignavibacteriae bacterium]|nr:glycoside hydrolase family 3 C-terminal domain-containing protein [Ignavibacteriota bacterium]MCB9242861.1 glycoside hydrolase family 3 C-terminal domain-containing protein [Ignavibacteriales bacterium]
MKRFLIIPVVLMLSGFLYTGPERSLDKVTTASDTSAFIEEKLSSMTLREKIGQMLVSSSKGFQLDKSGDEYKRLQKAVNEEKVGGFIFFQGTSRDEAELINDLQTQSNIPLLISADFERGTKMRLDDGSLFPNNMGIGATRDPNLAYHMGRIIAMECRALGIHQNYAPVVDVNNNANNPIINVRSFGEDPYLVSELADAMIKGLQDGGVIATAKHFPGHGDTDIDSHNDLPVLNFGMDRLDSVELVPYFSAIRNNVMSIMIAHLAFPAVEHEPFVPASLSQKLVKDLLIDYMGYKGLIVTDALNMEGIKKHFTTQQVAVMCVEAGIDLILMPQGEKETIDAIEKAVNDGTVTEERINESVRKILKAKLWLGLFENNIVDVEKAVNTINSKEAQDLSKIIAEASITLVKDDMDALPLSDMSGKNCAVVSINNGLETANTGFFKDEFEKVAKSKFNNYSYTSVNGDVTNSNEILASVENADVIVVPIYAKVKIKTGTVGLPQSQLDLIKSLIATGKKVIVISFGNPYLIQGFLETPAYICAYGDGESSISATIRAIFGEIKFNGKLPVSISDEYKFGTGLMK